MSKRARWIGWALITAFPPLLLGGIEACVRVFDVSPRFEREAALPLWLDRNILVKDARWMELLSGAPRDLRNYYSTYEWDRYLFYRLRPNLGVPLTDVLAPSGIRERTRWILRTNGKGFPGREAAYGSHPGVFRILCLGDSSTFGWGVGSEEAYPALLEQDLARGHPGLRLECVNLGVCGYSSLQGRLLLEREGLRYEPDLVTISYGSNDWSKVPEPFEEVYRRNAGWTGAVRALLRWSRAYRIYAAFLARAVGGDESGAVPAGRAAEMPWNVGPEKSRANLAEMVRLVGSAGAEAILVTNCVPGGMADPIREAARATGAALIDTEAILREAIPSVASGRLDPEGRARNISVYGEAALAEHPELEVYLADGCHPNPIGHRILAAALMAQVERTPGFRRKAGL